MYLEKSKQIVIWDGGSNIVSKRLSSIYMGVPYICFVAPDFSFWSYRVPVEEEMVLKSQSLGMVVLRLLDFPGLLSFAYDSSTVKLCVSVLSVYNWICGMWALLWSIGVQCIWH
jgi:hypothetical protein